MRLAILFILVPFFVYTQVCSYSISGQVIDASNNAGLEFAVIVLGNNEQVAYTDNAGIFNFQNLCEGDYLLSISHLSCTNHNYSLSLKKDTTIIYYLDHQEYEVQTITVKRSAFSDTENSKSIVIVELNQETIDQRNTGTLSGLIEEEAGIATLKTGNGIGKPIIHGLFGNRIQILNNGITIEGQQWGNEHAPEIDPFSIQKITLVKGVSALKYGTRAMGGVVLIESDKMPSVAKIHGGFNLLAFSNPLKVGSSLFLEGGYKKDTKFTWRMQASFSKGGDAKAPNYFLTNTASQDAAALISLQYKGKNSVSKLNFSTYYSKIGILRGSHIGNLTDLEAAFTRDEPFFTEDNIQFSINNPYQEVFHNVLKFNHLKYLSKGKLDFTYAFQYNQRKEFDIRRTSEKPSLFLNIQSQDLAASYQYKWRKLSYELGISYLNKVNYNDVSLNVKALIPNYTTNQLSFFSMNEYDINSKLKMEFGARYEFQNTLVKFFEDGSLETPKHVFHNYAANLGLWIKKYRFTSKTSLGFVQRSPEINELYSDGLHNGAAALEIGDRSLENEKLLSFNQVFAYKKDEVFLAQINPYYQFFPNYIYLLAQNELALTIRGAFPVYNFKATKASIWGMDFLMKTQVAENLNWTMNASIVRGRDLNAQENLSFMPADNLTNSLNYVLPIDKKLEQLSFGFHVKNVWEQIRTPEFDFVDAPNGFTLLGARISSNFKLPKTVLFILLEANNILNTSYRDYLNRWRPYADDLGTAISLKTKLNF